MTYFQLTEYQRYQIYVFNKAQITQNDIANLIGVYKSAISRELSRFSDATWKTITTLIELEWSTEQISGWLKTIKYHTSVTPEWLSSISIKINARMANSTNIYTIRCQKKLERKQYSPPPRKGLIPKRITIERLLTMKEYHCAD